MLRSSGAAIVAHGESNKIQHPWKYLKMHGIDGCPSNL
jgi:hypothetical protein